MPRGQYNRKPKDALAKANVIEIVPSQTITDEAWWAKLNDQEKATVQSEGQQLAQAMLNFGVSKLAIGEHLAKLRDVLEPHNVFGKFLRGFHFSKRTAYRYINGFKNAQARLPEPVLKAAMARGFNLIGETDQKPLGIYTDAVASLPVPQNVNDTQANAYLDSLENLRKQNRGVASEGSSVTFAAPIPQNPDTLLKEAYRFISNRYKKLPNNHKTKQAWVHRLIGMILAELGVSGVQTFQPIAIPEDFRAERGRPKLVASA